MQSAILTCKFMQINEICEYEFLVSELFCIIYFVDPSDLLIHLINMIAKKKDTHHASFSFFLKSLRLGIARNMTALFIYEI